jgi:hypothetical protein
MIFMLSPLSVCSRIVLSMPGMRCSLTCRQALLSIVKIATCQLSLSVCILHPLCYN